MLKAKPIKRKTFGIKRTSKKRKKASTDKVWKLKRADTEFRQYMLKTVPTQCVFPECTITDPSKLTISHYLGRVNKATRFDIRNCDFLCRNHHYWDKQRGWEFQKQTIEEHGWNGAYTHYMTDKLGFHSLIQLRKLAKSSMKQKAAIQLFQSSRQKILSEI